MRLSCGAPHGAIPRGWSWEAWLWSSPAAKQASCQPGSSEQGGAACGALSPQRCSLAFLLCGSSSKSGKHHGEAVMPAAGGALCPWGPPSGTRRYGIVSRVGQCSPSFGCGCWPLSEGAWCVCEAISTGRCLRCHLFCDLRHRELPAEFKHITWQRKRQQLRWLQ